MAATSVPRPTRLDRALAIVPLASIFVWLGIAYVGESVWRKTPTLFSDELKWTQLSRGIAETGHATQRGLPAPFGSLYAYAIAPAWWASGVVSGYDVAKYISMLVMTSAAFPAYFLARRLVSKPAALFVAAASVSVPSMAYGLYLIPEPLAYPWATLCAFLIVGALATRQWRWIGPAVAVSVVAPLVRGQLFVVPVAFLLAALWLWWQAPTARRLRRNWTAGDRLGLLLLAAGAFLVFNRYFLHDTSSWALVSEFYRDLIWKNVRWALGAFAIGVGVLPLIAGVVALFPPRATALTPWQRAFLALLPAWFVSFALYTGVKAAYLEVTFATRVTERNLFYVAPLFFVATAIVLERRQVRIVPLLAGVALAAYLVATTPLQLDYPYFEAFGFSILAFCNRTLHWSVPVLHTALYVTVAVAAAILVAARALRDRPLAPRARLAATAATAVVATALLAWNLGGEVSAARASGDSSAQLMLGLPDTLDWVDRDTRGADVTYLGQTLGSDGLGLNLLEFWNRSIVNIWSLDGTAPGPGPTLSPDLGRTDGTLATQPGTPYLLADSGVHPVGEPIDQWQTVRLYRLDGPIRLSDWVTGIEPDGWMSVDSAYSRFTGGKPLTSVDLTLSRQSFCPPAEAHAPVGRAKITVGRLIVNWNKQPAMGKIREVRNVPVRNCSLNPVHLETGPPPWRIEVHIDGTFRPVDFGGSDARELGAVPGYPAAR